MKTKTEGLVDRYLKRLSHELHGLTRRQRQEILGEFSAHIEESLAGTDHASEADVRNVLERLGDPEDIAREADERFNTTQARTGSVEIAALILLPIGGVILPVLGWVVGVILLWLSSAWTVKEKLIGTLVIPGGLTVPVGLMLMPSAPQVCAIRTDSAGATIEDTCSQLATGPSPMDLFVLALMILAPLFSAAYLIVKLRQRTGESLPT